MAETTDQTIGGQLKVWPILIDLVVPSAFICCALYYLIFPLALAIRWGGLDHGYWTYNAGVAALSYFDTGFARRELEGTLIRLFTRDPMVGAAWFHAISFAIFASAGTYLCSRPKLSWQRKVALGGTLLAILARLANDVGRTDAAVMVCGLIAAWAAKQGRPAFVAIALSVALLFHETGLIVLVPLVAGVALTSGSLLRWRSREALLAIAILGCSLAAYVFSLWTRVDVPTVARRIHNEFVDPKFADVALYANLTGIRGLKAGLCMNGLEHGYILQLASGVALCALFAFGLCPRRWAVALAISIPSFLALSLIGTDIGRWAVLGVFCVFTLSALGPQSAENPPLNIAAVFLGCALMASFLRLSSVHPPIPLVDNFAILHGMGAAEWIDGLDTCDPSWRSAIGLASSHS